MVGRNAQVAAGGVDLPERYEVSRLIGVGGMATIWAAEDRMLRRTVAIKVLAEQFAEQPKFVERFEREARTAASLSGHPHVVTIYDVGEHAGRPFIVMEHLPGGTFADRMSVRSGRPATTCCAGSARLPPRSTSHMRRGVVHRDVKPRNLLFDGLGPARGRRLRHRACRFRRPAHRQRRIARHGRIHLAGAGDRRAGDPGQRPLRVRGRRLRGASPAACPSVRAR